MLTTATVPAATAPPTLYGGQAVIEGVMMRGAEHFAVACRQSAGTIALTCEAVPKVLRPHWQKLPFLRGAFALVDAMALGTRALFWAAKIAEADIRDAAQDGEIRASAESVGPALGSAAGAPTEALSDGKASGASDRVADIAIGSTMLTSLLLVLGLVVVLPNLILRGVQSHGVTTWWKLGLIDGGMRFAIFFGYILLIGRMHHVRRVFQYHGAEHKTINALEAFGRDGLSVAAARAASRLHPRCGTSFVVVVLALTTLSLMPFYGLPPWERIPVHLAMTLPVAGIGFELLRLAGKYRDNPVAAALSRPGMWTQLLTTREPDDAQLEVAIASLQAVMDREKVAPAAETVRDDLAEQREAASVA